MMTYEESLEASIKELMALPDKPESEPVGIDQAIEELQSKELPEGARVH